MRLSRPCIDNSAARNRLDAGHLRIEIFEGYGNMEESFECCDDDDASHIAHSPKVIESDDGSDATIRQCCSEFERI